MTRHRVATIAVWTALVVALLLATLMILPTLLGFQRYVIISGSMVPTLPVGSVVYDEVVPVSELAVGDIITFVPPPEYGIDDPVTHRIVKISIAGQGSEVAGQPVFHTQGDANAERDAWQMVLDGSDQARVAHHVPYIGYVYMALSIGWVQLLVIGLPAFGILVYMGITLWRMSGEGVREERQRKEAATAGAGASP